MKRNFSLVGIVKRDVIKTALADCNKLKGVDLGYYSALPALNQHNKDSVLFHLLPYIGSEILQSVRNKKHFSSVPKLQLTSMEHQKGNVKFVLPLDQRFN